LRRRCPSALGTGKMLRPPVVEGVELRAAPSAGTGINPVPWPAVLAGFFQDETDDRRGLVVLANWTRKHQKGNCVIDLHEMPGRVTAKWIDGKSLATFEENSAAVQIDMPPYSVRAILLEGQGSQP